MTAYDDFIALASERVFATRALPVTRVAINGVDGAGKTRVADDIARFMQRGGGSVVRVSLDDFHNARAIRHARGRYSPVGFYQDAFNVDCFKALVLDPLSPGGSLNLTGAAFDYRRDIPVEATWQKLNPPAILVVDGLFLLRPELAGYWDVSIFLDVPFAVSFQRMAARDGSPPDPLAPSNRRYRDAQLLYFSECRPREKADLLVDYADWDHPRVIRPTHLL